jgi:hypothetical protein
MELPNPPPAPPPGSAPKKPFVPTRTLFKQLAAATRVRRLHMNDADARGKSAGGAAWSAEEEARLELAVAEFESVKTARKWEVVALAIGGGRTHMGVEMHYQTLKRRLGITEEVQGSGVPIRGGEGNLSSADGPVLPGHGLRQPKWSPEEDAKLCRYALTYVPEPGVKKWLSIATELGRTVVGCELHHQKLMRDLRNPPTAKPTPPKRERPPKEKKPRVPRAGAAGPRGPRKPKLPWNPEDEAKLDAALAAYVPGKPGAGGPKKWVAIAAALGDGRKPSAVESHFKMRGKPPRASGEGVEGAKREKKKEQQAPWSAEDNERLAELVSRFERGELKILVGSSLWATVGEAMGRPPKLCMAQHVRWKRGLMGAALAAGSAGAASAPAAGAGAGGGGGGGGGADAAMAGAGGPDLGEDAAEDETGSGSDDDENTSSDSVDEEDSGSGSGDEEDEDEEGEEAGGGGGGMEE